MKIALYIEDGLEQVVLTPESSVETDLLAKLHADDRQIDVHKGHFYECRGGYIRQGTSRESTMLVLRPVQGEDTSP